MTSRPQDLKFFSIFGHFVLLVPYEILSCYPNINVSHFLREEVKWIIAKVFRETYGLIGFDTFFSHFSPEFLLFACVFYSHKTYCDVL